MVKGFTQGASYITADQWLSVTDADTTRVYGGRSDFRVTSKIQVCPSVIDFASILAMQIKNPGALTDFSRKCSQNGSKLFLKCPSNWLRHFHFLISNISYSSLHRTVLIHINSIKNHLIIFETYKSPRSYETCSPIIEVYNVSYKKECMYFSRKVFQRACTLRTYTKLLKQ